MRLGTDFMLITPSGIDRATISPSDLVLVRMSDSAFDASSHLPASRAVHNHAAIYQRHPHVNAIMNGLSPTLPLSTATWSDFLFLFFTASIVLSFSGYLLSLLVDFPKGILCILQLFVLVVSNSMLD